MKTLSLLLLLSFGAGAHSVSTNFSDPQEYAVVCNTSYSEPLL